MNVGGWYDAGDFDLEEPAQLSVIQNLALAYREFDLKYDELTVDEVAREVEMHRPDGVPDTVEQIKHGALLILGAVPQYWSLDSRHSRTGLAPIYSLGRWSVQDRRPHLRSHTGSERSEGRLHPAGRMTAGFSPTTNAVLQWNAIAALAAASDALKGWDDALAKDCLETAVKAWNERESSIQRHNRRAPAGTKRLRKLRAAACWRHRRVQCPAQGQRVQASHSAPLPRGQPPPTGPRIGQDWAAALELTIATHGADPYKSHLRELFQQMITPQQMGIRGWMAVRALPYLDATRSRKCGRP